MAVHITDLSVELLLHIFQYCDIKCLCRLRQCCKRFNLVINSHKMNVFEKNALVTNQMKDSISSRYNKCRQIHTPSFVNVNNVKQFPISQIVFYFNGIREMANMSQLENRPIQIHEIAKTTKEVYAVDAFR